jgi:hypothetical protein
MLCDNCYHQANCEDLPDKNGRCKNYLKNGEIIISDELKFNPCGNQVYDYDMMKEVLDSGAAAVHPG